MKAGTLIGSKYQLVRPLGRGAMGEVWAAINQSTDGEVALKLLMPGADPEVRRRLLREAKACGRLKHRTIVEIYDVGETEGGEPFLVMQLLHGETLAQRLRRTKTLPVEVAVGIACDVATALRHAHERNIVHRDLKPANIFLHQEPDTEGTQTKVVDFGVSKLAIENEGESAGTMAGSLLGSPAYMSPEQARAAHVDGRSDLWALGVLLFEMLAGKRPFRGQTAIEVIGELHSKAPIARVETVAPQVNPRLGDVIAACLTRNVDERVASAAELLRLLRPFGAKEQFGTQQSNAHNLYASTSDARELPAPTSGQPARLPPPTAPARRASAARLSPPPVAAPSRESVTGLFQPQMMPLPQQKEEPSSDSMDATIMRPGLAPIAPATRALPSSPLGTQLLAPLPPALPEEPSEPSRDSMEAPTGMFNPKALLGPLYEERESQEPTGRLGPEAVAALEGGAVPYMVSESSRPTAEIALPTAKVARAPRGPIEGPSRVTPGAQSAVGGTLPMQPAYVPPDRDPSQIEGEDWKKRTVPLGASHQQEALEWKKRTVRLQPSFTPASPSAPEWRKSMSGFEPPSSPGLPIATTAQWLPSAGASAATSTSPVSRAQGGPASLEPDMPLEAPRTSNALRLVLIACSLVVVLSALTIVVVTIRREKPAAASGAAASASAALSASAKSAARPAGSP